MNFDSMMSLVRLLHFFNFGIALPRELDLSILLVFYMPVISMRARLLWMYL